MATRHSGTLGLTMLLLVFSLSMPASAELLPVKVWRCTIADLEPGSDTVALPDRAITLYEYRSPENCLDEALPPDGTDICRADYMKDGATETLWRARNNRDYCRPRAENLVRELVTSGFFCRTVESCEGPTTSQDEALPAVEALPVVEAPPVTEAASEVRNTTPIDRAASREKQLLAFFNGLFDAALAKAMTSASIPDDFDVLDDSTLAADNGATLRFTKGTHAWETRRDRGVLVINADLQRGQSFNDVFFGFAFDRSSSTGESDRHQFRYLGVVSPETASEVIYAGEDKVVISSRWYDEASDCYASRTTDEYQWSDSVYGTLQMRTISTADNEDCANR